LRISALDAVCELVAPVTDAIWTATRDEPAERCILVLGAEPGVGTTMVALATAITLVGNVGAEVSLVEADFESPRLARYLGLESGPGFSDFLAGSADLEECSIPIPDCLGLTVLPGGNPRRPSAAEFAAPWLRSLVQDAAAEGRYLLLDAPPLLETPQTRGLLALASHAVLVMRAGKTRWSTAEQTIELLRHLGVNLLGTVLNCYKSHAPFGVGG